METVTISGRGLVREYHALKAMGYTIAWVGEGKICMKPPAKGQALPAPREVIVEQRQWQCPYCGSYFSASPIPVHTIDWPDGLLDCQGSGAD